MTELSPAAQAVFDATFPVYDDEILYVAPARKHASMIAAAALRAATDQVIPMTKSPWGSTLVPVLLAEESRKRLLAIATELETQ